ncbi:MAG: M16 family metallopeptidase [Vulcanimicrobiaceae bacterium]
MALALDPQTHAFALANGLQVVLVPSGGAPVATVLVLYRVGSRDEVVGETGSSHLLEHLLFKGTERFSRRNGRAFADIMHGLGASMNATTSLDRTIYFETVPSADLPLALELEADRMRNALIADEDRRAEMTVVRNELERAENDPGRVLHQALVASAFREHPYHHPTIGWRSDVEGVGIERLRARYDAFYRPECATVVVVGEFERERLAEQIADFFGPLANAPAPPAVHTVEPPQQGERTLLVRKPGDAAIVSFAWHTPSALGEHRVLGPDELRARAEIVAQSQEADESAALEVLARILARGRTSRLSRTLVDGGLALAVSAWNWESRDPGLFEIVVRLRPGTEPSAIEGPLARTLAELTRTGPTSEELARAVRGIEVERALSLDGTFARAQRLAEYEAVGSWRLDAGAPARARAVAPEQVRALIPRYLHDDNRTLGRLLPGTPQAVFALAPPQPLASAASSDAPSTSDALPNAIPSDPLAGTTRGPLAAHAPFEPLEPRIVRATLANGIRVAAFPSAAHPAVALRVRFAAGPGSFPERPTLPLVLAEMLERGTRLRARSEIERELEDRGIRRSFGIDGWAGSYDPLALRLSAAFVADDTERALAIVAEELREPAFAPDEFELVRGELIGTLRVQRTQTLARALAALSQRLYLPGDPNRALEPEEAIAELESLSLDDLRAAHAARLLARVPLVSVAGALEPERFVALLERTLGALPLGNAAAEAVAARPNPAPERSTCVALEGKANLDLVLARATDLSHAHPSYDAAMLADAILGRSTLSSRLGVQLRDREGLTYGITSALPATGPAAGPWRVAVTVAPRNLERAVASVRSVLERFAREGPSELELERERRATLGRRHVSLATAGGIAAHLERIALFDLGWDELDCYPERLAAVTREAAAAVARTYFAPAGLTLVAAGTFAEREPQALLRSLESA